MTPPAKDDKSKNTDNDSAMNDERNSSDPSDGKTAKRNGPAVSDVLVSAHRIFVSHIPPKTTIASLREYFSEFGPISECSIKTRSRPRNGVYEQFAFIRYPNMEHAKNCLKSDIKHIVDGWRVTVQEAIDECGSIDIEGTAVIPTKMFVGGLPVSCDQNSLVSTFSKYGKIVDSMVSIDQKTNRSRLFGFIEFEDPGSVDDALKDYHAHRIDNKWVETKRCIPRDVIPPASMKTKPPAARAYSPSVKDKLMRHLDGGFSPRTYDDRLRGHSVYLDYEHPNSMEFNQRALFSSRSTASTAQNSHDRWMTPEYERQPYGSFDSIYSPNQSTYKNSTGYYHDYSPPRMTKAVEARQALGESLAINNMIPFLMSTNVAEASFLPTLHEMICARCEYLDKSFGALCGMKTQELASALEYAASRNMPDVVRMLIHSRVDINSCCSSGLTPLLIAAARGYDDVSRLLLTAGAPVNMPETREDRDALAKLAAQCTPLGEKPRTCEDIVMGLLMESWDGRFHGVDERGMDVRRKRSGIAPPPSFHPPLTIASPHLVAPPPGLYVKPCL